MRRYVLWMSHLVLGKDSLSSSVERDKKHNPERVSFLPQVTQPLGSKDPEFPPSEFKCA